MKKQMVDARGQPCPQPVVLTMKALGESAAVTVVVDNQAALENVTRLARSRGCSVKVTEGGDGIRIDIERGEGVIVEDVAADEVSCETVVAPGKQSAAGPVLLVSSDSFGRGSEELGCRLMGALFHTLLETEARPGLMIFLNAGVKLAVEGSRALEDIRELEQRGVDVLVCGTCLGYYELTDKLAAGRVSNMFEIATALLEADRVVGL